MDALTDDRLRALYAPLAAREPATRDVCPSPEQLLALVQRTGAEAERMDLLDHVMQCPACRKEFDFLRAVERIAPSIPVAPTPQKAPPRRNSWTVFTANRWTVGITAMAAAAVLALGVRQWSAKPDVTRSVAEDNSVTLISPSENTVDVAQPVVFVWHAAPGAVEYTLEVLYDTGDVAFSAVTSDTTAVLAGAATRLQHAGSYRWWVRALMPSAEPRRSDMRELRVAR